jgi:hypothetical protein
MEVSRSPDDVPSTRKEWSSGPRIPLDMLPLHDSIRLDWMKGLSVIPDDLIDTHPAHRVSLIGADKNHREAISLDPSGTDIPGDDIPPAVEAH